MNSVENYTDFLRQTAQQAFVPILARDFGDPCLTKLANLTKSISSIYKNLRLRDFQSIIVYTPLEDEVTLASLAPDCIKVTNVEHFTSINSTSLVIEVVEDEVSYCVDWEFEIDSVRQNAIIGV